MEIQQNRRRAADDEVSESYFISMSDLMAGVLFLFIIMMTIFALQFQDAPARKEPKPIASKPKIVPVAAEPLAMDQAKEAKPSPLSVPVPDARAAALLGIAARLQAANIPVIVDLAAGALRFPNSDLFEGASVTARGRVILSELATAMRQVLPCYAARTGLPAAEGCPRANGRIGAVFIEGHTDTGNSTDWAVSVGQGSSAFQVLMQTESGLQELRNGAGGASLLSVSGYGPTRPVQPGASPEQRRANSRLDMRLVLAS